MKTFIGLTALLMFAVAFSGCTHKLAINTDPPGATVLLTEVNGDKKFDLGQSPVKTEVTATGEYMVTAEKQGYSPFRRRITLGEKEQYTFELVPVYEIEISSEPEGALIILEDKGAGETYKLGKAPLKHVIESKGPFVVRASMAGYKETTMDLETTPGKRQVAITIKLTQ